MKTIRKIALVGVFALTLPALATLPGMRVAPSYPSATPPGKAITQDVKNAEIRTAIPRRAAAAGDTYYATMVAGDVPVQGVYATSLTADTEPEVLLDLSGYSNVVNALSTDDAYYVFLTDKTLKVNTADWSVISEEPWKISSSVYSLTYMPDTKQVYYNDDWGSFYTLSLADGTSTEVRYFWDDIDWADAYGLVSNGSGTLLLFDTEGNIDVFTSPAAPVTQRIACGAEVGNGSSSFLNPGDGYIYLSAYQSTRTSTKASLWKVDATTFASEKVYDRTTPRRYLGLGVAADPYAPGVPEVVTGFKADFVDDILRGNISFTLPSTTHDGNAGTGTLTWHMTVNGIEQQATGAWGETIVQRNVRMEAPGSYTFELWCTNNAGEGPRYTETVFIGKDSPKPPTNVTLTLDEAMHAYVVTWDAPDAVGVGGTEMDPTKYYYMVTRQPDNTVLTGITSINSRTFSEDVNNVPNAESGALWYEVMTVYENMKSEPAKSNALNNAGRVPPMSVDMSEEEASSYIHGTLDANNDGETWYRQSSFAYGIKPYVLKTRWSGNDAQKQRTPDDYLVLSPVSIAGGLSYVIEMDMRAYARDNIEYVTLYMTKDADTPEAIQAGVKVFDRYAVTAYDPRTPTLLKATFVAPQSGDYYPVLYCNTTTQAATMSGASSNSLYFQRFSIGAGLNGQAPAALKSFKAEGAKDGSNSVVLTMEPPEKNQLGDPLSGLTQLQIDRDGVFVTTIPANGHPTVWSEPVPGPGRYTYTVTTYNAAGTGSSSTSTAIVGFDRPSAPASLTVEYGSTPGRVKLTWEPVTTDIYGKDLPNVTYSAYLVGKEQPLATGLTGNTAEVQVLADDAEPQFTNYFITAVNEYGPSTGTSATGNEFLPVGRHYTLPMFESFLSGGSAYSWMRAYMGSSDVIFAPWLHNGEPYDGNGQLGFTYGMVGEAALFRSALIDIPADAEQPMLQFQYVNYGYDDRQEIEIMVDALDGNDFQVVDYAYTNLLPEKQWVQKEIDLSPWRGKTIRFQLRGTSYGSTMGTTHTAAFDCFMLYDLVDKNIGQVSAGRPSLRVGNEATITARYLNIGRLEADGYSVVFYANSNERARVPGAKLAAGEWGSTDFTFIPDASMQNATFSVEVVWDEDMDPEDNATGDFSIAVIGNGYPAVKELEGTMDDNGVTLQWSAPEVPEGSYEVHESFEEYDFGATTFNGFSTYDMDGHPVGGINIPGTSEVVSIPGITPFSTPLAWTVFDTAKVPELMPQIAARDGDKFAMTIFNSTGYACPGPNEDWIIFPLVSSEDQTLSFYVRSFNEEYPNEFRLMVSTTGPDPADFFDLDNVTYVPPTEWSVFELTVNNAAIKYLAVVDVTYDGLALGLDDISMLAEHLPLHVLGYHVYCDGVRVTTEPLSAPAYADAAMTEGEHVYQVSTLYDLGEGPLSAPLTLKPEGTSQISAVEAATDAEAVYYNLQGQRVATPRPGTVVLRVRGTHADKVLIM